MEILAEVLDSLLDRLGISFVLVLVVPYCPKPGIGVVQQLTSQLLILISGRVAISRGSPFLVPRFPCCRRRLVDGYLFLGALAVQKVLLSISAKPVHSVAQVDAIGSILHSLCTVPPHCALCKVQEFVQGTFGTRADTLQSVEMAGLSEPPDEVLEPPLVDDRHDGQDVLVLREQAEKVFLWVGTLRLVHVETSEIGFSNIVRAVP